MTVLATWPRQWSLSSSTQSLAYLEFLLGIPVTRESSVRNIRSISIMTEKVEILEKLELMDLVRQTNRVRKLLSS